MWRFFACWEMRLGDHAVKRWSSKIARAEKCDQPVWRDCDDLVPKKSAFLSLKYTCHQCQEAEPFIPGLPTVVPRAIKYFPVSLTSISLKTTFFIFISFQERPLPRRRPQFDLPLPRHQQTGDRTGEERQSQGRWARFNRHTHVYVFPHAFAKKIFIPFLKNAI